jgi:hypothetical protein
MLRGNKLAWLFAGCCAVGAVSMVACGSQTSDNQPDAAQVTPPPKPEPPRPPTPEPKPIPRPGPTDTGDPPPQAPAP